MATSGKIDDSLPGSSPSRAARPSRLAPAGTIFDLRNLLAERFPHPAPPAGTRLVTGLSFLDQAIGGGLPKSAITELISPQISAGSASLIHGLLHIAKRDRYFLALIDGADSFDPQSLGNACLGHLLWVRCRKAFDAIKAADLLLRDGNFPLVVVDLILNASEELRKIPQTSWYRLQRLVETAPTACLILSRQSMVSSAQLKIVLENSWTLKTFETEDPVSRLCFRIQRAHLNRTESVIAGAN
jgi:recA bacterial DNA recombination protein